jgi:hypothetical protein
VRFNGNYNGYIERADRVEKNWKRAASGGKKIAKEIGVRRQVSLQGYQGETGAKSPYNAG